METVKLIFALINVIVFFVSMGATIYWQWKEEWSKATFWLVLAAWVSMSWHL